MHAEAATIDGIVGAFFAGLGLNRAIPKRSPLMDRIQFFGSAKDNASASDVLVFPGLDAAREALERFPSFAKSRFLVAIAAHSAALAHEERVNGLVVSRSMTEHPAA